MLEKMQSNRKIIAVVLLIALFVIVAGVSATTETFNIGRYWLGSGGTSAGGVYRVQGSTGQPATETLTGGAYRVRGGFWLPNSAVPTNITLSENHTLAASPLLPILLVSALLLFVMFIFLRRKPVSQEATAFQWRGLTVIAVLVLGGGLFGRNANRLFADDAQESRDLAAVTSNITYQGYLTNTSGTPQNGTFNLRFKVYNAATGGATLYDQDFFNQTVTNGVFSITLGVAASHFNGKALWVEVLVNGAPLTPRQEIQPAPYALSLRPGALIDQDVSGNGITVRNLATGNALYGESAAGVGVYGFTNDNYAIYGYDGGTTDARGYGGYFYSENGVGTYGRSNAVSSAQNLWAPGVYGRSSNGVGVYGKTSSNLSYMAALRGENDGFGIGGYFSSADGVPLYAIRNAGTGNVMELWTLSPIARIFRINTAGNVYANGTYNSPARDFAELMSADDVTLEAGDVIVIGTDGNVTRSTMAYQQSVIGVYSTQPSFLGGSAENPAEVLDSAVTSGLIAAETATTERATIQEVGTNKIPVAIVGIVPVKVSTENGAIAVGDWLVASSTAGGAMRCEGVEACFGRTIGKALQPFEGGSGVIEMLVSLQ